MPTAQAAAKTAEVLQKGAFVSMMGGFLAPELKYARPEKPIVTIGPGKRTVQAVNADGTPQVDKKDNPVMVEENVTVVSLKVNSLVRVSNKGFVYSLPLKFAEGEVSKDWRH